MSRSPDNILLYLAPQQQQQVRSIFATLAAQGFPAQQQTPHISLTFSPAMDEQVVQKAAQLLPAVVPASLRRAGTVVFGTKRKQTVAWLLDAPAELEDAARTLSALNPDGRGHRWIPHLTMGLRLPKEIVPDYIRALDEATSPHFKELTAQCAGLWKPRLQQLEILAGSTHGATVGHLLDAQPQ